MMGLSPLYRTPLLECEWWTTCGDVNKCAVKKAEQKDCIFYEFALKHTHARTDVVATTAGVKALCLVDIGLFIF